MTLSKCYYVTCMIQQSSSLCPFYHLHYCGLSHLLSPLSDNISNVFFCLRTIHIFYTFGILGLPTVIINTLRGKKTFRQLLCNPHTPLSSFTVMLNTMNNSRNKNNSFVKVLRVLSDSLTPLGDTAMLVTKTSYCGPKKRTTQPPPTIQISERLIKGIQGEKKTRMYSLYEGHNLKMSQSTETKANTSIKREVKGQLENLFFSHLMRHYQIYTSLSARAAWTNQEYFMC